MKVGLDLALGVGKKLNENKTMDHTALKKDGAAEAARKAFTISKCAQPRTHASCAAASAGAPGCAS